MEQEMKFTNHSEREQWQHALAVKELEKLKKIESQKKMLTYRFPNGTIVSASNEAMLEELKKAVED